MLKGTVYITLVTGYDVSRPLTLLCAKEAAEALSPVSIAARMPSFCDQGPNLHE